MVCDMTTLPPFGSQECGAEAALHHGQNCPWPGPLPPQLYDEARRQSITASLTPAPVRERRVSGASNSLQRTCVLFAPFRVGESHLEYRERCPNARSNLWKGFI